jgi:hypothetical protein
MSKQSNKLIEVIRIFLGPAIFLIIGIITIVFKDFFSDYLNFFIPGFVTTLALVYMFTIREVHSLIDDEISKAWQATLLYSFVLLLVAVPIAIVVQEFELYSKGDTFISNQNLATLIQSKSMSSPDYGIITKPTEDQLIACTKNYDRFNKSNLAKENLTIENLTREELNECKLEKEKYFQFSYQFFNAYYYTVMTLTTVGYGEFTPVGFNGKLLSIFTSVLGTAHMVIFISLILGKLKDEKKDNELKDTINSAMKKSFNETLRVIIREELDKASNKPVLQKRGIRSFFGWSSK